MDVSTPQPEAGETTSLQSYQGQAFPFPHVLTLIGEENGGQALLQRGIGRLELNQDLTEVTLTPEEGVAPIRVFRPEPSGNFFSPPGSSFGDAEVSAGAFFVRSSTSATFFGSTNEAFIEGIIGFVTPATSDPMQVTLRYTSRNPVLPSLSLVAEGDDFAEGFTPDLDAMSLTVDFATGMVTGRLFRGSGFVDFEGDFMGNDLVMIAATIDDGRLEDGELRGDVQLEATIELNDTGDAQNLPLTVTSSNLRGRFYGNAFESLGVVYSGQSRAEGPDGEPVPIVFGGISLADR